jgi:hypothetical protein
MTSTTNNNPIIVSDDELDHVVKKESTTEAQPEHQLVTNTVTIPTDPNGFDDEAAEIDRDTDHEAKDTKTKGRTKGPIPMMLWHADIIKPSNKKSEWYFNEIIKLINYVPKNPSKTRDQQYVAARRRVWESLMNSAEGPEILAKWQEERKNHVPKSVKAPKPTQKTPQQNDGKAKRNEILKQLRTDDADAAAAPAAAPAAPVTAEKVHTPNVVSVKGAQPKAAQPNAAQPKDDEETLAVNQLPEDDRKVFDKIKATLRNASTELLRALQYAIPPSPEDLEKEERPDANKVNLHYQEDSDAMVNGVLSHMQRLLRHELEELVEDFNVNAQIRLDELEAEEEGLRASIESTKAAIKLYKSDVTRIEALILANDAAEAKASKDRQYNKAHNIKKGSEKLQKELQAAESKLEDPTVQAEIKKLEAQLHNEQKELQAVQGGEDEDQEAVPFAELPPDEMAAEIADCNPGELVEFYHLVGKPADVMTPEEAFHHVNSGWLSSIRDAEGFAMFNKISQQPSILREAYLQHQGKKPHGTVGKADADALTRRGLKKEQFTTKGIEDAIAEDRKAHNEECAKRDKHRKCVDEVIFKSRDTAICTAYKAALLRFPNGEGLPDPDDDYAANWWLTLGKDPEHCPDAQPQDFLQMPEPMAVDAQDRSPHRRDRSPHRRDRSPHRRDHSRSQSRSRSPSRPEAHRKPKGITLWIASFSPADKQKLITDTQRDYPITRNLSNHKVLSWVWNKQMTQHFRNTWQQ